MLFPTVKGCNQNLSVYKYIISWLFVKIFLKNLDPEAALNNATNRSIVAAEGSQ